MVQVTREQLEEHELLKSIAAMVGGEINNIKRSTESRSAHVDGSLENGADLARVILQTHIQTGGAAAPIPPPPSPPTQPVTYVPTPSPFPPPSTTAPIPHAAPFSPPPDVGSIIRAPGAIAEDACSSLALIAQSLKRFADLAEKLIEQQKTKGNE